MPYYHMLPDYKHYLITYDLLPYVTLLQIISLKQKNVNFSGIIKLNEQESLANLTGKTCAVKTGSVMSWKGTEKF